MSTVPWLLACCGQALTADSFEGCMHLRCVLLWAEEDNPLRFTAGQLWVINQSKPPILKIPRRYPAKGGVPAPRIFKKRIFAHEKNPTYERSPELDWYEFGGQGMLNHRSRGAIYVRFFRLHIFLFFPVFWRKLQSGGNSLVDIHIPLQHAWKRLQRKAYNHSEILSHHPQTFFFFMFPHI